MTEFSCTHTTLSHFATSTGSEYLLGHNVLVFQMYRKQRWQNTVEVSYNDLSLCETSSVALYILWYQQILQNAQVFVPCLAQYT
jgi:hypothetical protein